MIDEKLLHVYNATQSFDSTKGCAFSTYLAETLRWKCLSYSTKLFKNKESDIGDVEVYIEDEYCNSPDVQAQYDEMFSNLDAFVCDYPDKRIKEIMEIRFKNHGALHDTPSWKEIGKKIGISHERARTIYYTAMNQFKKNYYRPEFAY